MPPNVHACEELIFEIRPAGPAAKFIINCSLLFPLPILYRCAGTEAE